MATTNPFDLLVDDDNDDLTQIVQKLPLKSPPPAQAEPAKPAKLPSQPLPPAQAVREARSDGKRGGGRTGGHGTGGRGRGGRFSRDSANNENSFAGNNGFSGGYGGQPEESDLDKSSESRGYGVPRVPYQGGPRGDHRGGFSNGEFAQGERPRRTFDRHSGTGRGNEFVKRDGGGRGNWGAPTDEIAQVTEETVNYGEKTIDAEKQSGTEEVGDADKENPVTEPEEKEEPEKQEMTLEEYEKALEEKRRDLVALKPKERKVVLDKDFESMQLLSSKKNDEEIFVKLGSDKDKRKEAADKEEKVKKAQSINDFLKPAEGEKYFVPGARGRGRGRRGGYGGSGRSNMVNNVPAPVIEDDGQFPSLGAN